MEKPQKNVAVFFGGRSNEAEISVITGMYAVNLLRGTRYRVLPVWLLQLMQCGGLTVVFFWCVMDSSQGR